MSDKGTNLILLGLPGVGKSTIGQALAKELNWPFIDTDQLIEKKHNSSCREIFRKSGESIFRQLEQEVITSLNCNHHVISVGGGCVEREENCKKLRTLGTLIHLKTNTQELIQRKVKKDTPAYLSPGKEKQEYEALIKKRLPLLTALADLEVDLSEKEIDNSIQLILKTIGGPHGKQ